MKQIILVFFTLITLSGFSQLPVLNIGDKLPEGKKMECSTSEESLDLNSIKGKNGLLVIFSCNTCPFVVAWEDRYHMVNEVANDNNLGFALINSNYLKRDGADSFEAMKTHSKTNNYKWPYLLDNESELANSFGAQTTPHVFLFDGNNKLVYKGAIDDNHKDAAKVEEFYLKNALNNLGKGEMVKTTETRNLGCSIKRKTI